MENPFAFLTHFRFNVIFIIRQPCWEDKVPAAVVLHIDTIRISIATNGPLDSVNFVTAEIENVYV